jgi:ankyrin repeat protein
MIILLAPDRDVEKYYTEMLQAHTEGELVRRNTVSLLDDSRTKILTETDGSPITRISIIAHAENGLFAGQPPDYLATHLIAYLKIIDALQENASHQIKEIDIIGCDNGRVSEAGEGFTVDLARALLAAGYLIKINALTNLSHPRPYPCARMYSSAVGITGASPYGMFARTQADAAKYDECHAKYPREIKPRYEDLLFQREKKIESAKQIIAKHSEIAGSSSEAQSKLDKIAAEIEEIDKELKTLLELAERNFDEANAVCVPLGRTSNLRHYLDTDPQCDFTSRVLYELGPRRGRSNPLYKAARTGDIATLSEEIRRTPFCIDFPNDKGLTPLFAAAYAGQFGVVKTLLDAGADADLAPTMLVGELLSSLEPESRELARTLLDKKYGTLNDDMVVQLNPLEIAKIMQHEDVEFLLDCHEHHRQPMHQAVRTMRHSTLEALCNLDPNALNRKNNNGLTPLFLAAARGDLQSARILINKGALANIPIQLSTHALFDTLSAEAKIRATALLHERFPSSDLHETVSFTAADIAHINGYEDLSLRINRCVAKQAAIAIPMPVSEIQASMGTKAAIKIQSFKSAIEHIKAEGPKEHEEHEEHDKGEDGEETEGRSDASEKHCP